MLSLAMLSVKSRLLCSRVGIPHCSFLFDLMYDQNLLLLELNKLETYESTCVREDTLFVCNSKIMISIPI